VNDHWPKHFCIYIVLFLGARFTPDQAHRRTPDWPPEVKHIWLKKVYIGLWFVEIFFVIWIFRPETRKRLSQVIKWAAGSSVWRAGGRHNHSLANWVEKCWFEPALHRFGNQPGFVQNILPDMFDETFFHLLYYDCGGFKYQDSIQNNRRTAIELKQSGWLDSGCAHLVMSSQNKKLF
jgi:hypothetical protein